MRKSKGYAKGGAKMMRARKGKMAKGYAKGGAKMMKAMGGRMASKGGRKMMGAMKGKMAKGYSKGGAKIIKASAGIGVGGQKSNAARYNVGKFDKTGKNTGIQFGQFTKMLNKSRKNGGKFTVADVKFAYNSIMGDKKMSTKDPMTKKPVLKSRLTEAGKKLVKKKKKNN